MVSYRFDGPTSLRERDISIDEAGFEQGMAQQRARAREAGKVGVDYNN